MTCWRLRANTANMARRAYTLARCAKRRAVRFPILSLGDTKEATVNEPLVLVTGGSGFVGAHVIVVLIKAGYRVRTTVRSLKREDEVRAMVRAGGVEDTTGLSFVAADLLSDTNWSDAVAECDYVLHVASPFPATVPANEDDLIVPAREGTLRVLRAARDAGVKRVVLTSSFAAVGYGQPYRTEPYTEANWTNVAGEVTAYGKSKTLAERAAWDFIAREGGTLELAVVNPVGVFGPALGKDLSTSIEIIKRMLDGAMPGLPNLAFGFVDVRDLADLHLRAMVEPAAKGERFLAVADGTYSLQAIGRVLRERMGAAASRVPTRTLPNWMMRVAALFDGSIKLILPDLGHPRHVSNAKARRVLGWTPRSYDETIVDTAESLVQLGVVRHAARAA